MIAREEFNDIDIRLNGGYAPEYLLNRFLELGGTLVSTYDDYSLASFVGAKGSGVLYKIEVNGVKVDLVGPGRVNQKPDVNVNRLELTQFGIDYSYGSLYEIIQDIHNKEYIPEKGVSQERIDKIEAKGYKLKSVK